MGCRLGTAALFIILNHFHSSNVMRDIEQQLQSLDEHEIEAVASRHREAFEGKNLQALDAQGLTDLAEWMLAADRMGQHEQAANVFHMLNEGVNAYRERFPEDAAAMDPLIALYQFELRYMADSREHFDKWEVYQQLLKEVDEGPAAKRYRGLEIRILLMTAYRQWTGKGGRVDKLPKAAEVFMAEVESGYEALSDAEMEAAEERGDAAAVVSLFRNAAQFYFFAKQPNDAIACLKSALEELPKVPNYVEADSADLLMEIGQVFHTFKKFDVAMKYFQQALEIYERGDESLGMMVAKAEAWIETCKKAKG